MGYAIGFPNERNSAIENPPIKQGATFELYFTVILPASIMVNFLAGKLIDGELNATLRAKYRTLLSDAAGVAFTTATLTKASNTTLNCYLAMDSGTTAALPDGKGFWDCDIVETVVPPAVPYVFSPLDVGNRCRVKAEAGK